ncbi:MAG: rod shape-determining protein [candidate division WOR-3 bacterium]|nr:rod shape-determining protein [candidate division WOR-3 bacterium]MDH5683852.1 rod shape-determining protein [candidate division WOR-3 bacterium]
MGLLLRRFTERFSNDVAIDLGTSTTLIYVKGKGIQLYEPSIVAIEGNDHNVVAVGNEAKKMLGRTPEGIKAIRPMKDGVIADFDTVELMLKSFITMVQKKRLFVRPRVIICVPSGITEVEKRAVRDSVEATGAREIHLISEPIAAAIGVGLPVEAPTGNMIVDIGGGTTEIAVVALSGVVTVNSIRVAGDEMDEAIINYVKKNYNLIIGEQTAEMIKVKIGSAYATGKDEVMEVKGRDLVSGIPKTIKITGAKIREALEEPVTLIVEAVRLALEKTPPELAADIVDRGIYMAGGGSLLKGLDLLIAEETNLPVYVAQNATDCVVLGAGKVLENINRNEKLLLKTK